jgi:XTP/dITP diphosphohydrolase
MKTVVIATRNEKKLAEIRAILAGSVRVLGLSEVEQDLPEVEEDGETFSDNAIKKAVTIARITGLLTLADDSGLVVDALGGEPGVRSARFAGEETTTGKNNALLLERLQGVPEARRTARFVCVIALADGTGLLETFEGTCEGIITLSPRGSGGFGYDPLFFLPERAVTFAELEPLEKNRISHRGRALEQAARHLHQRVATG